MVTPRSTATWPSSGCSSPVIIRNSVVLPDPLGPTRPTFSPFWSAAEASMKRIWWPFCLLMLSRRIIRTGPRKELRRLYAILDDQARANGTPVRAKRGNGHLEVRHERTGRRNPEPCHNRALADAHAA